jgi:hypothetical protein
VIRFAHHQIVAGRPFPAGLSVVTDYPGESTDVWMVASMVASTVVGPMAASMAALTVAWMAVAPTVASTVASMVVSTDVTADGWRAVKMAATDSVVTWTDSAVTATDSVVTWTSTGYGRPSIDHRHPDHRHRVHRHRGRRGPLPWERSSQQRARWQRTPETLWSMYQNVVDAQSRPAK